MRVRGGPRPFPNGRAGPVPAEATLVPEERKRIEDLEQRVVSTNETRAAGSARDLELLADLYFQVDHYEPALETLEALLVHPNAARLSDARRAALTLKQGTILRRQGRFAEAWERLAPSVSEGAGLPRALAASCAIEGAMLLCHLARYDEALDVARRGVQLAEAEGDRPLLAKAVGQVGFVHLRRGDMLLARESYEEALPQFRRLGDDTQVAWVRNNLGIVCKNLCEWDAARVHFNEAIAIHRRLGQQALLGNRLQNLGVLLVKSGSWERAHAVLEEARQCFAQVGDRWGATINLLAFGWLDRLEGRLDEAEKRITEALDKSLAEGFLREEALSREFLGDVAFERGQVDRAAEAYRAALALGERQAPAGDIVSEVLRRIAEVEIVRGRLDAAETAIERAVLVCQLLDDRYENAVLQRVRGQLAAAQGRREDAAQFLRAAVNLFGEMGERFERGKSLTLLARIVTEPGEPRKLLYRASACFAEIGADRQLAEVERELAAAETVGAPVAVRTHSEGRLKGRKLSNPGLVGPSRAMARVADLVSRAAGTDLSVHPGRRDRHRQGAGRPRASTTQSRRAERPFVAVNCGALRAELVALAAVRPPPRRLHRRARRRRRASSRRPTAARSSSTRSASCRSTSRPRSCASSSRASTCRLGETAGAPRRRPHRGRDPRDLRRAVARGALPRRPLLPPARGRDRAAAAARAQRGHPARWRAHFLARLRRRPERPRLGDATREAPARLPWPGNVRELENCIKRALALLPRTGEALPADGLAEFFERSPMPQARPVSFDDGDLSRASLKAQVAEADRRDLVRALDEAQGNKSRAAERLGVSRKTLYARMRRLGLEVDEPA